MHLHQACIGILNQLINLTEVIKEDDFCRPVMALSQSSIGQHLRHTIEFFLCLEHGYTTGYVNYDNRCHDKLIETSKPAALSVLHRISAFVQSNFADKVLQLEVSYSKAVEESSRIATNYFRELSYNIEHAVHHMAIMKIGIREIASYIELPVDFGVAVSTLRYQEAISAPPIEQ